MSNTRVLQTRRFVAFSGDGKQQTAKDVPLADADIDTRDKCTVEDTDAPLNRKIYDCEEEYLDAIERNANRKIFTFTYSSVTPQIMARWAGYYFGSTAAPTGSLANEVQTLTLSGDAAGLFKITMPAFEGRTGVTKTIPVAGITADIIKAALTKKGATIENIIKDGDVTVVAGGAGVYTITFGGRLANANIPLMTVDSTGVSAGTVAITPSANGSAKYFPFVLSTEDEKPLFSFALGDKTGDIATEKYYNAVCSTFVPTKSREGTVGLTVTVLCDYYPEDVEAFPVPPCINYTGLKFSDCKLQIGGNWEFFDLFTETITLDDKMEPDNGFDSFSPDTYYKGTQREFPISGDVFAVKTDPIGEWAYGFGTEEIISHFGQPGNRFSIIMPAAEAETARRVFVGSPRALEAVRFTAQAKRDGVNPPVRAEYYGNQSGAFLET